ncbi:flagellar biosynthesis protein FlhF [Caminicella sporogenes DSM 14501]|uniref:Flagellar biosynthesis protein FlhF n=1 Tax=Caminicella sporogenes DSM 14501 TaxID=1121266 RepID=A0A1M6LAV6_9FIRM|nr:flagellar biosynthesis protein FlhF [Caminicella sporogenes]RKD27768.1 flagellar biosynthesis protein FlhF [Caminicella sporogenes]SHJ68304.1 flagellar biosynthesis protein FlhF [Caminicella sporogenes DSM 14501]
MKVKRYIAKDIQEAMIKIKSELGRDAIILHTRKIRKPGIRGFLQKPLIEVIAAVDSSKDFSRNKSSYIDRNTKSNMITNYNQIQNLNSQINTLKDMINTVIDKINFTQNSSSSDILKKYENILIENNVSKPVTEKILSIVSRQISISDKNEQSIRKAIKLIIKDILGTPYEIDSKNSEQKIIFFVGPTGVGKTTTLAKLASKFTLINEKSVALITADTYRIAAVEQIKTYSEILDIPLTVIYEPKELKQAIDNYSNKDFILIDTAGRNHKDKKLIEELEKLITFVKSPEVFLLISLTTTYNDVKSIINSYNFLNDYKLVFTKFDEASLFGNVLNAKILTSKPISYITTGQGVPDDIEVANTEQIANSIVGEYYERSSI